MIRFTFRYDKFRYDIALTGRYNVIVGNSGEGKTMFATSVQHYMETPEFGSVSGGQSIAVLTQYNWMDVLKSSVSVVVVDEDFILSASRVLNSLQQYDHLYILMCRGKLNEIPFGISNVFKFDIVSKFHRSMRLLYDNSVCCGDKD